MNPSQTYHRQELDPIGAHSQTERRHQFARAPIGKVEGEGIDIASARGGPDSISPVTGH